MVKICGSIGTRKLNRESSVEQLMSQASIYAEKRLNETNEVCKLLQKIKDDAPMHDLFLKKNTNKELVAKVSRLEEKCMNLEKGIESQKKTYMEREREKNRAFEEEMLKAEQKLKKLEVERDELMERIVSMEERFKKLELETQKLVDGKTDEYEDIMFGNEDDTVYVDFDQLIGNF